MKTDDDATDAADTIADTSAVSCEPRAGVFDEGSPPCPAPREKKKVTGIALVPAGHGLSKMAEIANNVLADGFDKGDIQLSLWVDGTYAPGCDAHFVFVEDPTTDILDDCTPRYVDAMPLVIPGLVRTEVFGVSVNPATNTVTGLVDEAALIASMDPALHEIADNLIDLDVDTECDGTADKASAILTLTFE